MDTRDDNEARRAFADFLTNGPKSAKHVGSAGVKVSQALDWYDTGIPGSYPGHVAEKVVAKGRQRNAIANLKLFFGSKLMRDVDINLSEDYARKRRSGQCGRVAKDGTIRRELGVLVAAAHWCAKRKVLPLDQMPQVEKPSEPAGKAPWLTKESIRAIFDGADGKLRAFCRLAYYWGARRQSVEALWVSQVDLQHSRVDLHKPGAPRTKKRRPIVPIYPEIRKDIETLLLDTDNEYLFGSPRTFYVDFVELCKRLEIRVIDAPDDKSAWPHLLRHSRATHMLMDGEDPYKVAKLLGDTLQTVERVYGHHTPEYLHTKSNVEVG